MAYKILNVKGKRVLLDPEDYEKYKDFTWSIGGGSIRYLIRKKDGNTSYMHTEIMGLEKGDKRVVDHISHNSFDNRKFNLRVCSASENHYNQKVRGGVSKYKGVARTLSTMNPWMARIKHDGSLRYIGIYKTEDEAAVAYNEKATELFGEYALLNRIKRKS